MKKLFFLIKMFFENLNGGYKHHSIFKKIKRALELNSVLVESINDGTFKIN